MSGHESRPGAHLRVVRGDPTPEEVAALVAVLTARARAARAAREAAAAPRRSAWRDPSRLLRAPLRPGPDAWRTSLR
ncbi:acyl-CoA carboxylase subunit epsilon [Marinitenerispora sediminis]|uniref:Acyl-CoA dehydrogenase n=1 Tax=Marinitenerispora sediminis TaxID=1931232 RepID=A0A368T0H2_9ACTN|nr:acyl-CoA carboxylase subunit epsilon [Marinitenerispora sediminis]RCV48413.1 acyl-CoA dehydrogenase [Marinitenerispora sediminis]RCV49907.1 acyl-CoA dehydrogenase [Marinitenerispora sediminis]RCV52819.1 acyl-CoA dehydrogenase [Marinitenerispora sediminis]